MRWASPTPEREPDAIGISPRTVLGYLFLMIVVWSMAMRQCADDQRRSDCIMDGGLITNMDVGWWCDRRSIRPEP